MNRYHIWTIGCQMNDADSRRAAEELQRLGYLPTSRAEEADVVLLNTCVVRQKAQPSRMRLSIYHGRPASHLDLC